MQKNLMIKGTMVSFFLTFYYNGLIINEDII